MKNVIIIGSGISGMTCACALANKGYKVHVFEKQRVLGGYCQSFQRRGFHFGAAVHRVGGIYGKENVNRILKTLGVRELPQWYTFREKVIVGNREISMCNSDITKTLKAMYPEESEKITAFWDEVLRINNLLNIIDQGANKGIDKFTFQDLEALKKYRKMTVDEFLRSFFDNNEIIGVLVAISDAMPGGALFAFVRMIAFANCGEETFQPIGGAGKIIETLANRLKELGGEIHLESPVDKIIVENKKAIGVTSLGNEYFADFIISNCDMNYTVNHLVGKEHVSPRLINLLENKFTESPSCFSVWIGLDQDIKSLGYEPINVSYYPNGESVLEDKEKLISSGSKQRENDFLLISLSANNDPSASPDSKGQMMLGMLVNWDFENLAELRRQGKNKEYNIHKREIAYKLVEKAEKIFPHIKEHIEVMEIASPATFERYTGNSKGAFGGYKCTPNLVENYSVIDGKQIIGNLFSTGHWGGVGDGVIFTTDVAMRITDKVLKSDGRNDFYDFNKENAEELKAI